MTDQPETPDIDVNIPLPEGLRVTGEEPYRMLMVGDFAGSSSGSLSGLLCDGLVEVTADTFDRVLAEAAPQVSYQTTDPLASGSVMVEVSLKFDSLKSFAPEALWPQIPATRTLMDVRQKIAGRMRGEISTDELASAVASAAAADAGLAWLVDAIKPTATEPAAAPEQVDALLGQLDLGDDSADDSSAEAPPPKSPIGSLVSAAAGGGSISQGEAGPLRKALAEIDRRVTTWLNEVMHSAPVQQLESAWRSLALLVGKIDFRKGLRLSLLHASRDAMLEKFSSRVIDPVFDQGADAPDLIVVDAQFGNAAPDMEALDEFAQHAASLPAVVLAGVSPQFFGVKHAWQIPTLPPIVSMFDQWQFAKWKTLREQPYASMLGVVFGRCLLRGPSAGKDGNGLDFAFKEKCMTDKDLVWASGSVAAACTVAGSFARTGWPAAMAGHVHGRIEGLPMVLDVGPKGDKQFGPTDTQTPQAKIEEMGMAGINAVAVLSDSPDALLWNGLTAARPARVDPNSLLEVSLPYHLFAGRLSSLLLALKSQVETMAPEMLCTEVIGHVRTWLKLDATAGTDQVSAQVREAEDDPRSLILAVTVTPPTNIIPGGIPVVLGFKLTRH